MDIFKTIQRIQGKGEISVINENNNPYRVLVHEGKRCAAYYFSMPIYNEGKRLIKAEWTRIGDKKYFCGANAKIVSEEKSVTLKNYAGYASITFPETLQVEPTLNGIYLKGNNESFEVRISVSTDFLIRGNDKSFAWMQNDFVPFMTISGIMGRNRENCFPVFLKLKELRPREYVVKCYSPWPVDEVSMEINLHTKKIFFDTTVESINPDMNNAFGGIAFVGYTFEHGEQWLYSKFDIEKFMDLANFQIKKALFYIPRFNQVDSIAGYKISIPWCSIGTTWSTKTEITDEAYPLKNCEEYVVIEVTEVIKSMFGSAYSRNAGIVLKGEKSSVGYCAIATGDNYYTPQILKIVFES